MSRIVSFLIILGGIVGVYFAYLDFASKQKDRHNHWVEDIRALMRDFSAEGAAAVKDEGVLVNETSFFRILGLMHEAEQHKYSAAETVKAASSGYGVRSGEAKMAADMLIENYHIATHLGIFNDLASTMRLVSGEAPMAQASGWEDEPLAVGCIVSPLIAPEACRSLANLVLMPTTLRDLQTDDLGSFTPDMAKKWLVEHIITPESHHAIMDILATRKL